MSGSWEPTKDQLTELRLWAERLVSPSELMEPEDTESAYVNERKNIVLWLLNERQAKRSETPG